MDTFHTCETTHCRAGWVIHLAGEAGYALEERFNSELAAMLIYRESGYRINPCRFYDSNDAALEDMRRLAEAEVSALTGQPTPDWQIANEHEPGRIVGNVDGGHGEDGWQMRCTNVCEVAEGPDFEANRRQILASGPLLREHDAWTAAMLAGFSAESLVPIMAARSKVERVLNGAAE